MSNEVPAPSSTPQRSNEIRIVSHSSLFYWWPVWALGFLFALITWWSGDVMTTVPGETRQSVIQGVAASKDTPIVISNKGKEKQEVKLTGDETVIVVKPTAKGESNWNGKWRYMSDAGSLGVIYCAVLLLVIFITNIPLRGLWSVIVIIVLVSLVIILATLGAWDRIVTYLSWLDIRINLGGYLFISIVLFALWLIVMVFFDTQVYMVFTPGQFRVRQEIGDAETAYDTVGMTLQKQRSDLFRHWILGLGSGDLIVRTSGAQAHEFHLNNVLFLGRKVKLIEEMLRSRPIVTGQVK